MTQQYDLTFNTANTMDKMFSQPQSYSKESGNADNFGKFLDSANKTYATEKKSFSENKSNLSSKTNNSQNKTSNTIKENKTEYKDLKNDENISNQSNDFDEKDTVLDLDKNTNLKDKVVETVENGVQNETVVENTNLDVKNLIMVSELQNTSTQIISDDTVDLGNNIAVVDTAETNELPVEAIKSRIDFDTLKQNLETGENSISNEDVKTLENSIKDTVVDKNDTIATLYKSNEVIGQKSDKKELDINSQKDLKVEKVSQNTEKVEVEHEVNDVKDVKNETPELKAEIKEEIFVGYKDNSKLDDKTDEKLEKVFNIAKTEKVNTDENLTSDLKVENDLKSQLQVSKNDEDDKTIQKNTISVDELKEEIISEVNKNIVNTVSQKTDNGAELKTTPQKLEQISEEVETAKQENAFEMLDKTKNNQDVKTKKVDDKLASTNIKSDETMEINDDVKGIEFVSKKDDKVVDEKISTNVKEKVENIKINVEDNVKVTTQLNQDANKTEKANETLSKAGLTTETLKKIDGKVTEMEMSENNSNSDFGETSKEMMMRDMLTQDLTEASTDSKNSNDFVQALSKTQSAKQPQMQQSIQDIPDVDIMEQMRTKIAINSKNGLQKMTFGLTPESLGKVTVEIVKNQNGLSAQILPENPQAKEILDKNLDGLKSTLQSQGVNVNNVNVKISETNSSSNNNNMFQDDESQFNQNSGERNSDDSNNSEKNKHSEYEFIQKNMMNEISEEPDDVISRVSQVEKTVNIQGGLGKVNYKL